MAVLSIWRLLLQKQTILETEKVVRRFNLNDTYIGFEDAIKLLSQAHPITKEYAQAFECAVACMEFVRDFMPLNATPERMKHALNLLNALEYINKINK